MIFLAGCKGVTEKESILDARIFRANELTVDDAARIAVGKRGALLGSRQIWRHTV